MNFLFLFNLILLTYVNKINADKFVANAMYNSNICTDVNIVTYSYEKLTICDNKYTQNKCNVINKLANVSTKVFCGSDSLDNTKSIFNTDFIYMETYDLNCNNKIGAVSIALDKCLLIIGQGYLKFIKNKQSFESKLYSDNICKNEIKLENTINNQTIDVNNCADKIKIYTKDGLLNLKTNTETEPTVTEPTVTEPAVTEPAVTEPADTTIETPTETEPTVTEPVVTEPVDTTIETPTVTEPVDTKPTESNNSNNKKYSLILSIFINMFLFIQY
jgi:hypothetical protein